MKHIKLMLIVVFFLVKAMNSCDAEALFQIGEESAVSNYRHTFAFSSDLYFKNGLPYVISISKNCIERPFRDNYYFYVFFIGQKNSYSAIHIKQILVASESDSVVINAPYPYKRQIGLETINDEIEYSYDPGKVNRVLLSSSSKLLIRIITTQNQYYDFYATPEFIECAKKVADWS